MMKRLPFRLRHALAALLLVTSFTRPGSGAVLPPGTGYDGGPYETAQGTDIENGGAEIGSPPGPLPAADNTRTVMPKSQGEKT